MDDNTYDAILWLLHYLKQQELLPDVTECTTILETHLTEIEKEHAGILL